MINDGSIPKQKIVSLSISKDSWHYKYYCKIRKFWGMGEPPIRTSLCPYFQTIFWFSILVVVTFPLIILGYCITKTASFLFSDDSLNENLQEKTGITTLGAFAFLAFSLLIGGGCLWLIYKFIFLIPTILGFMVGLFLYMGFGIYNAFGLIGFAIEGTASWLLSTVTSKVVWSYIGFYGVIVIGSLVGVALIGIAIFYIIDKLKIENRLTAEEYKEYLATQKRLREEEEQRAARLKEEREAKRANRPPSFVFPKKVISVLFNTTKTCVQSLFHKEVEIDGKTKKILGPIAVFWLYLKSLKNKACPIVSVIDEEILAIASIEITEEKLNRYFERIYEINRDSYYIFYNACEYIKPKNECYTSCYFNDDNTIASRVKENAALPFASQETDETGEDPIVRILYARYIIGEISRKDVIRILREYSNRWNDFRDRKRKEEHKKELQELQELRRLSDEDDIAEFAIEEVLDELLKDDEDEDDNNKE